MIEKLDIVKGDVACFICGKIGEGKLVVTDSADHLIFICNTDARKMAEV